MSGTRYVTCPDCSRRFDMRDEDNWARLLEHCHDCEAPTPEHCGHAGADHWTVTYRWSIRRAYTVRAATAAEAIRAAENALENDDEAPNHEPDDVEADWDGNDCPDCTGSGYIPAIGPDAPESGYVECDTCHGSGTR